MAIDTAQTAAFLGQNNFQFRQNIQTDQHGITFRLSISKIPFPPDSLFHPSALVPG